jgi:hypothetical protein
MTGLNFRPYKKNTRLDVLSSLATRLLVQPLRPAQQGASSCAGAGHGTRRAQPHGMGSWITRSWDGHARRFPPQILI